MDKLIYYPNENVEPLRVSGSSWTSAYWTSAPHNCLPMPNNIVDMAMTIAIFSSSRRLEYYFLTWRVMGAPSEFLSQMRMETSRLLLYVMISNICGRFQMRINLGSPPYPSFLFPPLSSTSPPFSYAFLRWVLNFFVHFPFSSQDACYTFVEDS